MKRWRPLWSGHLAFGLITIPVKLYTAIDASEEPHFRLLDRDTLVPIKEVRVDPKTGGEVPWPRIVRGVEYARGRFVPLTNEELKGLPLTTAHTIELSGFVAADEIDPVYFERAYYLGPNRGGEKAYALLRDALAETGKAGLGKVAIRTRERIAAITPRGRTLAMHTLLYAEEVRRAEDVPDVPARIATRPTEERMARQLIETMTTAFDPSEYKSEYRRALNRLVRAKLENKSIAPPKAAAKVIDLQEALRESLRRAPGRDRAGRRRAAS
jgi:DNA end-binding protein Ku